MRKDGSDGQRWIEASDFWDIEVPPDEDPETADEAEPYWDVDTPAPLGVPAPPVERSLCLCSAPEEAMARPRLPTGFHSSPDRVGGWDLDWEAEDWGWEELEAREFGGKRREEEEEEEGCVGLICQLCSAARRFCRSRSERTR